MFRLAYNSNGFRKKTIFDTLDCLSSLGYEAVEISLHRNHLDPFYHSDMYIESLRRKVHDTGLTVANVHTGAKDLLSERDFEPSLISVNKKDRQRRIELILKAAEVSKEIGCKYVTVTSGVLPATSTVEESHRILCDSLDELVERNKTDTMLLIENEMNMLVERAPAVLSLLDRYPRKLGVTYDIGHAECCHEDISAFIDRFGSALKHMHFEDIKNHVHHHLLPGEGDIDFKSVVGFLLNHTYTGYCSIELYTYSDEPEKAAECSKKYFVDLKEKIACLA
ncbi:MAG: sugar phosphate isomerase/epimerase [Nitrospirota bacterium]|nr:sugar phosphate isomerase/epimerase [Nitrospirota bacterium]